MPTYSSSLAYLRSSPFLVVAVVLYGLALLSLIRPSFSPASSLTRGRRPVGLESLWPERQDNKTTVTGIKIGWRDHNAARLHSLLSCLATDSCGSEQQKVVVLQAPEFRDVFLGKTVPEASWARSIMTTLESLGLTYLFAKDADHASTLNLMLPEYIKAVVMSAEGVQHCGDQCVKTKGNPLGIPIQSLFALALDGGPHPLGNPWTLTPEGHDDQSHTYLGYSIEHECMAVTVPDHHERKRQVWVFGEEDDSAPAVPQYHHNLFAKAAKELDVEFVGSWEDSSGEFASVPGVTRLGGGKPLSEAERARHMSHSLATVGLFMSQASSTPYHSLCYGVPFLNLVLSNGGSQQSYLSAISPDHGVYPVTQGNDDEFISQLRLAIQPHARYIPLWMTQRAMDERVKHWLSVDWTQKALDSPYLGEWVDFV